MVVGEYVAAAEEATSHRVYRSDEGSRGAVASGMPGAEGSRRGKRDSA